MNHQIVHRGLAQAHLARRSVAITRLGIGGAPLGNLQTVVPEAAAAELVKRALALGVRYFDTAPVYGMGLAESRLGHALAGTPRESVVVSTKVGRLLRKDAPPDPDLFVDGQPFFKESPALNPVWDFSYQGTLTSLTESLERLQLAHVDIVFLHEPPDTLIRTAAGDGYRALQSLRRAGDVNAIGIGWDRVEPMADLVSELDLDLVLLAGRYSLLDQSAGIRLLPVCLERGTSIVVGGVFNSGILASNDPAATYDYLPASDVVRARVAAIREACDVFDVPVRAAALQFPLAHPAVVGVVLGMRSAAELYDNLAMLDVRIPDELWARLKKSGLLPDEAPTPQRDWH